MLPLIIAIEPKLISEQWAAYEWLMKSFNQSWGAQVRLQEPAVGL
jgi:hypothetical protein